jgi:hypothetical protein
MEILIIFFFREMNSPWKSFLPFETSYTTALVTGMKSLDDRQKINSDEYKENAGPKSDGNNYQV